MSDFVNPKPFFNEQLTKQLSFRNLKDEFDDIMYEDIIKYIKIDQSETTRGYYIINKKNDIIYDFRYKTEYENTEVKMFIPKQYYQYEWVDKNLLRNEIFNILNFNTSQSCFINENNVKRCDKYYRIKNSTIYQDYFREIQIKQQLCNNNNYCIVRGFFLKDGDSYRNDFRNLLIACSIAKTSTKDIFKYFLYNDFKEFVNTKLDEILETKINAKKVEENVRKLEDPHLEIPGDFISGENGRALEDPHLEIPGDFISGENGRALEDPHLEIPGDFISGENGRALEDPPHFTINTEIPIPEHKLGGKMKSRKSKRRKINKRKSKRRKTNKRKTNKRKYDQTDDLYMGADSTDQFDSEI
jgi:hypothetical protein